MDLRLAYKIIGTVIALIGMYLIAKHNAYLQGLIFLAGGVFLALKMGVKPR